jgi:hypothetical protein
VRGVSYNSEGGELRGAKTPWQRSSADFPTNSGLAPAKSNEKEEMPMKVKKNTETPRRKPNKKHLFLTVVHLLVVILFAFSEPFYATGESARALP